MNKQSYKWCLTIVLQASVVECYTLMYIKAFQSGAPHLLKIREHIKLFLTETFDNYVNVAWRIPDKFLFLLLALSMSFVLSWWYVSISEWCDIL